MLIEFIKGFELNLINVKFYLNILLLFNYEIISMIQRILVYAVGKKSFCRVSKSFTLHS